MNDFEANLAERLNDLVDHEAGGSQGAPPFVPLLGNDKDHRRSTTTWVLVAAVVFLVAAMTWAGLTRVVGLPGPQVAGPSTKPSSDLPSASQAPSGSSAPSAPVNGSITLTDGTTLVLPSGWVVSDATYGPHQGPLADKVWCIDPEAAKGSCTISLSSAGVASKNPLDVDIEGGWSSNPSLCINEPPTSTLDVADVRTFGGRNAEHRVWTECTTNIVHVEQYEVAYAPASILYSERADGTVSAVMASIAQRSQLPPQTFPLRLMDRGYVRSVKSTAAGVVLTLNRLYLDPSQPSGAIATSVTTEYMMPTNVTTTQIPILGDRIALVTNGTVVTAVTFYGG